MSKKKKSNQDGNVYDRIFKENAQYIFIPLIEMELGMKILSYQPLQEKMTKTLEREVDFLYKVEIENQKESLLHIEFQTQNEKDMIFRMQEYHGIIQRKYNLPIHHIVIFLGKGQSNMTDTLQSDMLFRGFKIINLYDLSFDKLLSHQVPEVVLLALLSNHKKERVERILQLIIDKLKQLTNSNFLDSTYAKQLLLLSRLRNLEPEIIKIIEDMPIIYDIEKDTLYKRGHQKGLEKSLVQSILGLHKIGLEKAKIAEGLGISIDKVNLILAENNLE